MDSSSSSFCFSSLNLSKLFLALALAPPVFGCYTSIFNFGDSLSDTGNLNYTCASTQPSHVCFFPYGETFFHRPTGRFSNGRLILDFIAQSLGLPLVQPYLGRERIISIEDFGKGLNFAVGGATALDASVFRRMGIQSPTAFPTQSLGTQLQLFNNTFSSLCRPSTSTSRCKDMFKSSLFFVGEIGGNDYIALFFAQRGFEVSCTELIELGAETVIVPGNIPMGCLPICLKLYETSNQDEYDPKNGCLHEMVESILCISRAHHPHVHLIYVDYYNSALRLYNAPGDFGFTNSGQVCCVNETGSYSLPTPCGIPSTVVCKNPSEYISWDGVHMTEAAYRFMAIDMLQQLQFTRCSTSQNASPKLFQGQ